MQNFRKLELNSGRLCLDGKELERYEIVGLISLPLRREDGPLNEGIIFNAGPSRANGYYIGKSFNAKTQGFSQISPVLYIFY